MCTFDTGGLSYLSLSLVRKINDVSGVCFAAAAVVLVFSLAGHISCQRRPDYITNLKNTKN